MPSRTKILNNRVSRRLQADLAFFLPFLTTRCPVPVLPGRPAMHTLLAGDDARLVLRHGCRIIVQSRPTANRRAGPPSSHQRPGRRQVRRPGEGRGRRLVGAGRGWGKDGRRSVGGRGWGGASGDDQGRMRVTATVDDRPVPRLVDLAEARDVAVQPGGNPGAARCTGGSGRDAGGGSQ